MIYFGYNRKLLCIFAVIIENYDNPVFTGIHTKETV